MEYSKIKKLANNYIYESAFWDTTEEYLNAFDIIDAKDIKTFDFLYKIELNNIHKEYTEAELIPIFTNNIAVKFINIKDNSKYIIFHPCTNKEYKYQLSYFDQYGAIMDEKRNTIEEIINCYMYNRNYELSEVTSCHYANTVKIKE